MATQECEYCGSRTQTKQYVNDRAQPGQRHNGKEHMILCAYCAVSTWSERRRGELSAATIARMMNLFEQRTKRRAKP